MFGFACQDIVAQPATRIVPPDRIAEEERSCSI
jgi:hypothetical protein